MVVIDVDRFKAVNDSYGHLVGDKALESISAAVQACCGRATFWCATAATNSCC